MMQVPVYVLESAITELEGMILDAMRNCFGTNANITSSNSPTNSNRMWNSLLLVSDRSRRIVECRLDEVPMTTAETFGEGLV